MQEKEGFLARKQREGLILNDVQRKAVLHTDGPMLLLASPGSGKTTTIVMKIGYLIEEKKAVPSRIKAITFSRASAADMRERFARLCPELPVRSVDFSTIHSLAFAVTREHLCHARTDFQIIEGDVDLESREKAPMGMEATEKVLLMKKGTAPQEN
ncbi:UvrD-helicase domain-containing protein [Paenibacillus popilliae]|uniref:DNA and RNA helicase n=1 Tax=Paenibacillus popilliae ATCC 14706 TaxID=1212764 RepID=M9M344_PAEPP|nr:DNA and RNA helicase [Paenibacillus popilliae ATCC 14706]